MHFEKKNPARAAFCGILYTIQMLSLFIKSVDFIPDSYTTDNDDHNLKISNNWSDIQ